MTGAGGVAEGFELRVLRQVSDGGVSTGEGGYAHHGCPIGGDMAAALTRLLLGGCLILGQPGRTSAGRCASPSLGRPGGRRWSVAVIAVADSPDVVTGVRLLDVAKRNGFVFRRIAPGPDGPRWKACASPPSGAM